MERCDWLTGQCLQTSTMEWTDEKTLHLIEIFKEYKCLYDISHIEFKNRALKKVKAEKMAVELQTTGIFQRILDTHPPIGVK